MRLAETFTATLTYSRCHTPWNYSCSIQIFLAHNYVDAFLCMNGLLQENEDNSEISKMIKKRSKAGNEGRAFSIIIEIVRINIMNFKKQFNEKVSCI